LITDNRQPQTGACGGFVRPDAALQHRVAHRRLQARAVIIDGNDDEPGVGRCCVDGHASAAPFAGVVDKVAEHLVQIFPLDADRVGR
jgi:hypothetical protein